MEENNKDLIDIGQIVRRLLSKKKTFAIVLAVTFVVSCALILCVPRTYTCEVKLAPELGGSQMGGIESLASSFGVNLGDAFGESTDAIGPDLYPDLIESTDFQVSLFPIRVKSIDGSIDTNYYNYLDKMQKKAFWTVWLNALKNLLPKDNTPRPTIGKKDGEIDPFMLTKRQYNLAKSMNKKIVCTLDKKTYVISIVVTDQDPLICATLADSIKNRLQDFITEYRTKKAKNDLEYSKKLFAESKKNYLKAQQRYAEYADSYTNVVLKSYQSKVDEMENEMQLQYNNYTAMAAQLQAAKAKLQEKTPAFTTLQGATVPVKATGPKRMLFVLGMLILAFIVTSFVLTKDILFKRITED